jgi:hypothetical protein
MEFVRSFPHPGMDVLDLADDLGPDPGFSLGGYPAVNLDLLFIPVGAIPGRHPVPHPAKSN